jgi:hypothetical protein
MLPLKIIRISLNIVLAGLRLGLKNRQVGKKWVFNDCSYLCITGKGFNITKQLKLGDVGEKNNSINFDFYDKNNRSNLVEFSL